MYNIPETPTQTYNVRVVSDARVQMLSCLWWTEALSMKGSNLGYLFMWMR